MIDLSELRKHTEKWRGQRGQWGHSGDCGTSSVPNLSPVTPEAGTKSARHAILSPVSPLLESQWGQAKAYENRIVPAVPNVPIQEHQLMADFDAKEAFEERAAIMEYDGHMSRAEAERWAILTIAAQQRKYSERAMSHKPGGSHGRLW